MWIRDPVWKKFGSGTRDGKKSDLGSGMNIPDPQHWFYPSNLFNTAPSAAPLCREDAGIEPRTVATRALAVRLSNHSRQDLIQINITR